MWIKKGKRGTIPFFYKGEILSSIEIGKNSTYEDIENQLIKSAIEFIKVGFEMNKSIPQMINEFKFTIDDFYKKRFILKQKTSEDDHCNFIFALLSLIKLKQIDNDSNEDGYLICLKKKKRISKTINERISKTIVPLQIPLECHCDAICCSCLINS